MQNQEYKKIEYYIYPHFYKEFYRNFLPKDKGIKHLILAGIFLHLTFENILTFYIRYFVNVVIDRFKNGSTQQFWDKVFEGECLPKKLDFFYFVILSANKDNKDIIKNIKSFYNELAELRNKAVHGYEISEKDFQNGENKKSKLFVKLEPKQLEKLYNDFWVNLKNFLGLFIVANSIQIDGIRWREDLIREDFVDKPIKVLKQIEEFVDTNNNRK